MVWGGGFLWKLGAQDFAGGIVIHVTAGMGSLVTAWFVGPRIDFHKTHGEFPPSNLPLAATGATLLWMGWFGFNGGSALSANPVAILACINTQVACAASAIVWAILSTPWCRSEHLQQGPPVVAVMNGAVAGLAGVTPASGFISFGSSLVLGVILGFSSYAGCKYFRPMTNIDDALDVTIVHGLAGAIGSLFIGFAGDASLNSQGKNGLIHGESHLLWAQSVAILMAAAWSGIMTLTILFVLQKLLSNLRHRQEDEGLDTHDHDEIAYSIPNSPVAAIPQLPQGQSSGADDSDTYASELAEGVRFRLIPDKQAAEPKYGTMFTFQKA